MRAILTPAARQQVAQLKRFKYRGRGFLLGARYGGILIIESLWTWHFSRKDLPGVHASFSRLFRQNLLGVFYAHQAIWISNVLIEDCIMEICGGRLKLYRCSFDAGSREPALQKIEISKEA